jgi:hypothetical protein
MLTARGQIKTQIQASHLLLKQQQRQHQNML